MSNETYTPKTATRSALTEGANNTALIVVVLYVLTELNGVLPHPMDAGNLAIVAGGVAGILTGAWKFARKWFATRCVTLDGGAS